MKNPKVSRRKEILKIRAWLIHVNVWQKSLQYCKEISLQLIKINEKKKETKETIEKINKAKSCFFEKINKIDKSLSILIKKQREENQINKIRNENEEIMTDNTEIQRIIRDYYQ